ncbi:MAG: hypothetical protein IKJ45_03635, partial [Kiritimatiellae bacterium]|nr:hypothetical protein [Kiritimatiellia bacterium]
MIDIAFSSDQAFVPNLLVASASAVYACRGGGDEVAVHVLDCGIGDAAWSEYIGKMQKLAQSCGVTTHVLRHAIDMQLFANVKAWTNGSRATWARLLLPRILLDVHCCVYSDCDVLFIENPAGILDELKASGRAILGHRNPFGNHSPDGAWFRGQKLPFDADSYFCAGLVGVNLDMMRKAGTDDACWEFLQKFPNPVSVDQTVLNYVCRDSKGILSDGWGLFTHECYVAASPIKAIHFSGGWPWAIARNV